NAAERSADVPDVLGTVVPGAAGVLDTGERPGVPRPSEVVYDSRRTSTLAPGETRVITVPAFPATAAGEAVLLTVTAVAPRTGGYLTVWGEGDPVPATSTLNFTAGVTVANAAVVRLTPSARLNVRNGSGGRTDVIVALQAHVQPGSGDVRPGSVRPVPSSRLADTRRSTPVPPYGYRDVTVAGGAVPRGAGAAARNVTAVSPTRPGYLVAHSPATTLPTTTALSYQVGTARAALSTVPLSADGRVRLWNMSAAPAHLVVDVFGWVAGGPQETALAGLHIHPPTRIADTRTGGRALHPAGELRIPAAPRSSGQLLMVTVTGALRPGYLQYRFTSGVVPPSTTTSASVLNWGGGDT
ncbi:MAG: hypothetical protein ACRCZP_12090, partial [Phycicoccus sp.]